MTRRPELSICIPTHHGRAQEFTTALDSVLDQLTANLNGRVEVCISDNASWDGTEALVRERQRLMPGTIQYRRNAIDVGASRNMLRVVEMARGRWAWLLGSDDALERGALESLLGAMAAHPDVAGASVNRCLYEQDFTRPAATIDVETPPLTELSVLEAPQSIDALGLYVMYMSAQVIRTSCWRQARARVGERTLEASIYPHAWLIVSSWLAGGAWLWEPNVQVRTRLGNTIFGDGNFGSLETLLTRAVRDQTRLWHKLVGRSGARAQLARLRRQVVPDGHAHNVAFQHLSYGARNRRSAIRMAAVYVRAFWRTDRFWRDSVRALIFAVAGRPANASRLVAAREELDALLIRVAPERDLLISPIRPREIWTPTFLIENRGAEPVRSRAAIPLNIAGRWFSKNTGSLIQSTERVPIGGRLGPGRERRLRLPLVAPSEPGDYTLRVGLVAEGVGWLDDVRADSGWRIDVRVRQARTGRAGVRTGPSSRRGAQDPS